MKKQFGVGFEGITNKVVVMYVQNKNYAWDFRKGEPAH